MGIGLAAPQVGISLRIVVMDDGKRGTRALINPVITERRGTGARRRAACRCRGSSREVERAEWVRVRASMATASPWTFEAQGLRPAFQHEIDHLDGMLFIDQLPPMTRDRIKRDQEGRLPRRSSRRAHAL